MFFSLVNCLICPQGQHINVYIAAHVIRHSLKNYKQRSYESLLGWNCIQFFPTDSPYGSFVWSFTFPTSLPPPQITHDPFLKFQHGSICSADAGSRRQVTREALTYRCWAHPAPNTPSCLLEAVGPPAMASHPGSGISAWRDTSLATLTTSANFEQEPEKPFLPPHLPEW